LLRRIPAVLFRSDKNARMKFHDFREVCQKILGSMVAGIKMIFVLDALSLKLPMEFRGSFFKSEFIIASAVEIDGQPRSPYLCPVPLRKDERTVLVPVTGVNGIAEYSSQ